MNQKDGSRWELRLGLFQVVVLLGLIMGFLTCSFFLGYFSGRQVGQDAALSASLTNTIKLPIDSADQDDHGDENASQRAASDVYAKLNDNRVEQGKGSEVGDKAEIPQLGTIDRTDVAPVDHEAGAQDQHGEALVGGAAKGAATQQASDAELVDDKGKEPSPSREQLLKQVIALEEKEEKDKNAAGAKERVLAVEKDVEKAAALPTAKTAEAAPKMTPTAKSTSTPKSTATPKPVKTEKAVEKSESVQKGWFAQVAAPKKKEDASELSKQLRKSGFSVILEVAQVKGEQYYRILAGPEPSKEQAEKLVEQLKREPYIPTKPFIRQIK